jgi:hypothetical protein
VRLTNGAGILRYAYSSYSFGVRSRRGKAYDLLPINVHIGTSKSAYRQ